MTKRTAVRRPKRSNGEGTISLDSKTGRYRIAVTTGDPTNPRLYARADTQPEAITKLRELQAEVGSGAPVGSNDSLAEWLDYWLSVERKAVERGEKDWKTLDNYRWACRHLKPAPLGTKTLRELQPEHVELALQRLADAGLSRGSVVRVKTVLGQALDFALARRRVSWNVAKLKGLLPVTPEPVESKSLTEDQLAALWKASKEYPLQHAFLVTGWQLGLRPGELLGLAWPEVDLAAAVLTVSFRQDRGGQQRGGGQNPAQARRQGGLGPAGGHAGRNREGLEGVADGAEGSPDRRRRGVGQPRTDRVH